MVHGWIHLGMDYAFRMHCASQEDKWRQGVVVYPDKHHPRNNSGCDFLCGADSQCRQTEGSDAKGIPVRQV